MTFRKLKKCPYCSGDVRLMNHGGLYYVDCGRYACDRVLITYYETPEEAITGWNECEAERRGNEGKGELCRKD